jgi:hypothetical protein
MSKQSGLGAGLLVGGYDLSGDIGSLSRIASPRTVLDVTGIDKFAFERLLALKDGAMDFMAYFNPASNQAHPVLSALPRTDVGAMYLHKRSTQGTMCACMVGKQINYDPNREQSGALTFGTSMVANNYGLEWAEALTTGIHTASGAGNLTGYNDSAAAATNFGLQAYLQVMSFTGTSVTITIQDSNDNGSGDAYAAVPGAAFSVVSAANITERIQTSRTENVKEWLRINLAGTFTNLVFAVAYVRNLYTVNF